MATLAFPFPAFLKTTAFTQNGFEPRCERSAESSAALTRPKDRELVFSSRGDDYRIVVRTNLATTPAWVEPVISDIMGIQTLPENWDSYGGKKTNLDLISRSLSVLGCIMEAASPAPSVVPLGDGGLQLEWHRKQQDLEITFAADDAPQFFYRNRAIGVEQDGYADDVIKLTQLLRKIA